MIHVTVTQTRVGRELRVSLQIAEMTSVGDCRQRGRGIVALRALHEMQKIATGSFAERLRYVSGY